MKVTATASSMSAPRRLARALGLAISLFAIGGGDVAAHDIYSGVHGKTGQLCCGGDPVTGDCAPTQWALRDGRYFLRSREGHWIEIPAERIDFLPVPGDEKYDEIPHLAHLCYREARETDSALNGERLFSGEGQTIFLYCAFIKPGSL